MPTLKQIVEGTDTRAGRMFNIFIQCLIIVAIVAFTIDTIPNLSARSRVILQYIELVTISLFILEYLLRLTVADNKLKFVTSFFGIIDLLAIVPYLISFGSLDMRSVRVLRLLRIFQLLKLARYTKAVRRYQRAFMISREEIVLHLSITLVLLYLAAVGIYYFESDVQPEKFASVIDSLWWSITTLSTVGYGDAYPVTPGGKVFTFFILLLGLAIVAVPAGLFASAFSKVRELEAEEKKAEEELQGQTNELQQKESDASDQE